MGAEVAVLKIVLTVASVLYQQKQAKKAKRAAEEAARRAKEQAATRNVRTSGSSVPIEFLYGYTAVTADTVNVNVANSTASRNNSAYDYLGTNNTGSGNNRFLITQKVLGFGPLERVQNVDVEGSSVRDEARYRNYSNIEFSISGNGATYSGIGTTSPYIGANNRFEDIAYATEAYYMDKDDPQFGGTPSTFYYVKGRQVRDIIKSGDTYSVSANRLSGSNWTNNAVLVLLDYLLDSDVGVGLKTSDLDLESFYNAKVIADTVVIPAAPVTGKVFSANGNDTTRAIKKYEFNGLISSSNDHIDNIGTIIDTMSGAVFLRDATGKIKLSIPDVESLPADPTDSELKVVGTINESQLVKFIDISFPDASEKLNGITVTYPNASKNFANDSLTYSNEDFLTSEDQGVVLETSLNLPGVSNKFHADFLARFSVLESRRATYSWDMSSEGFLYEPGDVVRLQCEVQDIDTLVRIGELTVNADLTVKVTANQYLFSDYTWSADDDETFVTPFTPNFGVGQPNLLEAIFDTDSEQRRVTLKWTPNDSEDHLVDEYQIERSIGNEVTWANIATVTKSEGLDTEIFVDTGIIESDRNYYRVRAITIDNRKSAYSNTEQADVVGVGEGAQGPPGAPGTNGASARVDIAYARGITDSDLPEIQSIEVLDSDFNFNIKANNLKEIQEITVGNLGQVYTPDINGRAESQIITLDTDVTVITGDRVGNREIQKFTIDSDAQVESGDKLGTAEEQQIALSKEVILTTSTGNNASNDTPGNYPSISISSIEVDGVSGGNITIPARTRFRFENTNSFLVFESAVSMYSGSAIATNTYRIINKQNIAGGTRLIGDLGGLPGRVPGDREVQSITMNGKHSAHVAEAINQVFRVKGPDTFNYSSGTAPTWAWTPGGSADSEVSVTFTATDSASSALGQVRSAIIAEYPDFSVGPIEVITEDSEVVFVDEVDQYYPQGNPSSSFQFTKDEHYFVTIQADDYSPSSDTNYPPQGEVVFSGSSNNLQTFNGYSVTTWGAMRVGQNDIWTGQTDRPYLWVLWDVGVDDADELGQAEVGDILEFEVRSFGTDDNPNHIAFQGEGEIIRILSTPDPGAVIKITSATDVVTSSVIITSTDNTYIGNWRLKARNNFDIFDVDTNLAEDLGTDTDSTFTQGNSTITGSQFGVSLIEQGQAPGTSSLPSTYTVFDCYGNIVGSFTDSIENLSDSDSNRSQVAGNIKDIINDWSSVYVPATRLSDNPGLADLSFTATWNGDTDEITISADILIEVVEEFKGWSIEVTNDIVDSDYFSFEDAVSENTGVNPGPPSTTVFEINTPDEDSDTTIPLTNPNSTYWSPSAVAGELARDETLLNSPNAIPGWEVVPKDEVTFVVASNIPTTGTPPIKISNIAVNGEEIRALDTFENLTATIDLGGGHFYRDSSSSAGVYGNRIGDGSYATYGFRLLELDTFPGGIEQIPNKEVPESVNFIKPWLETSNWNFVDPEFLENDLGQIGYGLFLIIQDSDNPNMNSLISNGGPEFEITITINANTYVTFQALAAAAYSREKVFRLSRILDRGSVAPTGQSAGSLRPSNITVRSGTFNRNIEFTIPAGTEFNVRNHRDEQIGIYVDEDIVLNDATDFIPEDSYIRLTEASITPAAFDVDEFPVVSTIADTDDFITLRRLVGDSDSSALFVVSRAGVAPASSLTTTRTVNGEVGIDGPSIEISIPNSSDNVSIDLFADTETNETKNALDILDEIRNKFYHPGWIVDTDSDDPYSLIFTGQREVYTEQFNIDVLEYGGTDTEIANLLDTDSFSTTITQTGAIGKTSPRVTVTNGTYLRHIRLFDQETVDTEERTAEQVMDYIRDILIEDGIDNWALVSKDRGSPTAIQFSFNENSSSGQTWEITVDDIGTSGTDSDNFNDTDFTRQLLKGASNLTGPSLTLVDPDGIKYPIELFAGSTNVVQYNWDDTEDRGDVLNEIINEMVTEHNINSTWNITSNAEDSKLIFTSVVSAPVTGVWSVDSEIVGDSGTDSDLFNAAAFPDAVETQNGVVALDPPEITITLSTGDSETIAIFESPDTDKAVTKAEVATAIAESLNGNSTVTNDGWLAKDSDTEIILTGSDFKQDNWSIRLSNPGEHDTDNVINFSVSEVQQGGPGLDRNTIKYPSGFISNNSYTPAIPNPFFTYRAERYVSWDSEEPAVSTLSSDYDFVKYIGDNGTNGEIGERGVGRWNVLVNSIKTSYSNAELNRLLRSVLPEGVTTNPLNGDQLWIYTEANIGAVEAQKVYLYRDGNWLYQTEVIDGNLLVTETITGDKLVANSVSTGKLRFDSSLTPNGDVSLNYGKTEPEDFDNTGFFLGLKDSQPGFSVGTASQFLLYTPEAGLVVYGAENTNDVPNQRSKGAFVDGTYQFVNRSPLYDTFRVEIVGGGAFGQNSALYYRNIPYTEIRPTDSTVTQNGNVIARAAAGRVGNIKGGSRSTAKNSGGAVTYRSDSLMRDFLRVGAGGGGVGGAEYVHSWGYTSYSEGGGAGEYQSIIVKIPRGSSITVTVGRGGRQRPNSPVNFSRGNVYYQGGDGKPGAFSISPFGSPTYIIPGF